MSWEVYKVSLDIHIYMPHRSHLTTYVESKKVLHAQPTNVLKIKSKEKNTPTGNVLVSLLPT